MSCARPRPPHPPGELPRPIANASAESQPARPYPRGPTTVYRNARVMTATGIIYERGDLVVANGVVAAVGMDVPQPHGATVVDLKGKTITPGIIDTHSHIGVAASPHMRAHSDGNEMVGPNTAYARARDGYWPQDPQVDAARAGGVTTMQVLPGSANLIGGRSVVVKTYPWARSADDARFVGAPDGLKMACGENPKRVYGDKGGPNTRMGNIAGFRQYFQAAQEYRRNKKRYRERAAEYAKTGGKPSGRRDPKDPFGNGGHDNGGRDRGPPEPPPMDHGLETLVGVLNGTILVHNHCYRADEMSIMMDLAEEFGFRIRSFHHAVEAYKIADRLAAHGAAASVWADWWGFKMEAYDGIRENAALISAAGARSIIHSDSAIGIQRLNQEAAKAMYAGRRAGISISEDEALRWITANPAWALGVHDRIGTLETGKVADFVVWDRNPFSVYAHADRVYIEGDLIYDRNDSQSQPRTDFDLGLQASDYEAVGR